MSKNRIRNNSEFFFNLYQKFNKEILEEILDKKLDELLLEKYYLGQKVDVYCTVKGVTTEVFIESMLSKADGRHLHFILKLIDNVESNAIIVFQAKSFTDKIIEKILSKVKKSGKIIGFYAIEIDETLIKFMESLNEVHFLKVIEKIKGIEVSNPFNIVEKYNSIGEHGVLEEIERQKMSRVEGRNEMLINEIRKKLDYFPTVFREKRCLNNRILSYSAGRSDVTYFISIEDRNGNSFVSVQFTKDTVDIYKKIKSKKQNFREKVGYDIKFDDANLMIRTELIDREFIYKTIDDLAEIFERYVFYLSNYIFYFGTNVEDIMLNQHKEGTL